MRPDKVFYLSVLVSIATTSLPAIAQDGFGPVKVKDLDLRQRTVIMEALRPIRGRLESLGLVSIDELVVQAGKEDCPSTCNDEYIGGQCYCGPDDEGNCPEGSEKTNDTNPTPGRECQADPESFSASGGGLSEPVTVQRP